MSRPRSPSSLSRWKRICGNGEDEMLEFQKQNNIGFIQEEGNSAAAYLVRLNQQLRCAKDGI